jgi:hypothetical protein
VSSLVVLSASAVSAAAPTIEVGDRWEGTSTREGTALSITIGKDGCARIATDPGGFRVRCSGGQEIRGVIEPKDSIARVGADGTIKLTRRARFSTTVTGRATAREVYTGRISRSRARLKYTVKIRGKRANCRTTVRWSLRSSAEM